MNKNTELESIRTNPPCIMRIHEAAAYMAISPRKLRYMISEGRIKAIRFERRVILRRKDIDATLEAMAY